MSEIKTEDIKTEPNVSGSESKTEDNTIGLIDSKSSLRNLPKPADAIEIPCPVQTRPRVRAIRILDEVDDTLMIPEPNEMASRRRRRGSRRRTSRSRSRSKSRRRASRRRRR